MVGLRRVVFVLALAASLGLGFPLAAGPGSEVMIVVYPGEAGDQASAKNPLTTFMEHLAKQSGLAAFDPLYFNNLNAANKFLAAKSPSPRCGILALSVYLDWNKRGEKMTLVAQGERRGVLTERFHLFVAASSPVKELKDLKDRTVVANYLDNADFTNKVVFKGEPGVAPLTSFVNFVSSKRPLEAAKACAAGKKFAGGPSPDAVIMDDDMLDGVKELRLDPDKPETLLVGRLLREVWTSRELPTPPVVWFGAAPEGTRKKLEDALVGMKKSAPEILKEMKCTGFAPPDAAKYGEAVKEY